MSLIGRGWIDTLLVGEIRLDHIVTPHIPEGIRTEQIRKTIKIEKEWSEDDPRVRVNDVKAQLSR